MIEEDYSKAMPIEKTLDPEDWESMRALGHRMLDDMLDYLKTVRQHPWRHAPNKIKAHFNESLPLDPHRPEEIYEEFLEYVLPYPMGNIHPRFWGWVGGTGTVYGAFAEFMAATMNIGGCGNLAYYSANYVEKQVIDWFKEMLGFPPSASGILTSGCSAANLIGLAVARNTKSGYDLRKEGINTKSSKMVLYASDEIHSSIQKAVELLGLGSNALRLVPINEYFQIDIKALEKIILEDRKNGYLPFCVVGAVGTTNTGAIDDIEALADICQRENIWLHIDGAFGAWAALAPGERHLVTGIERADSLAFDLHKWMYMQYEIGCILVRCEEDHRKAFSLTTAYIDHGEGDHGMTGRDLPWLCDYGFQLSRGFRALKAWMSLKEHGTRKYGQLIQQNINQARYLAELVENAPELELAAPVTLNAVCFRYTKKGLDDASLDELNKRIEIELQEQGIAMPSTTTVRGKCVLHVVNTNHRSRREDFDVLVREAIRIGKDLSQPKQNAEKLD